MRQLGRPPDERGAVLLLGPIEQAELTARVAGATHVGDHVQNGIAQIDEALRSLDDPDWRTRLRVSLETWVSILADQPHFARVLLIDVLGAGPRALAMREQVLAEYVAHYRGLRERARAEEPGLPDVPDEFLRGLVGGLAELVQQVLLQSEPKDIPARLRGLTDTMVSFAEAVMTSGG